VVENCQHRQLRQQTIRASPNTFKNVALCRDVSHGWHLWETVLESGQCRFLENENNPSHPEFQAICSLECLSPLGITVPF